MNPLSPAEEELAACSTTLPCRAGGCWHCTGAAEEASLGVASCTVRLLADEPAAGNGNHSSAPLGVVACAEEMTDIVPKGDPGASATARRFSAGAGGGVLSCLSRVIMIESVCRSF